MKQVKWDEVLFRPSCVGKIMTQGKGDGITEKQLELIDALKARISLTAIQKETLKELEEKRDAPPKLSDTCISYLKEVYVYQKYGKEPVGGSERSKYTMKGNLVEHESRMIVSRLDGLPYEKNEDRYTNLFLTGTPDVVFIDRVLDLKSSWDFSTLLSNENEKLNPLYFAQMQCYLALTDITRGEVDYCLVNMPPEAIHSERMRIFYSMNPVTEEDPAFVNAVEKMENNYTFDEIPIEERVLRFPVEYSLDFMNKVYSRIEDCRSWLIDYDNMRMTNSKKLLTLK